jgi:hypothetical protein
MIFILFGEHDTGLSTCANALKWATNGVIFEDPTWTFAEYMRYDLDRYLNLAHQGRTVILVFSVPDVNDQDAMRDLKVLARHLATQTRVACVCTANVWRLEE